MTTRNTTAKASGLGTKVTKKNYIRVDKDNVGTNATLASGIAWLKPAQFGATSVTIDVGDKEAISGFLKAIELRDVNISIVENDNGYPTLLIQG